MDGTGSLSASTAGRDSNAHGFLGLELSAEARSLLERIRAFMAEHVYPHESEAAQALSTEAGPGAPYPRLLVELREKARSEGLWNLFLPAAQRGAGLLNWEYGLLCEEMGRAPALAPAVFNCAAPDTGNIEILHEHGSAEQKKRWLQPLLDGEIRSCFSMTEPEVSGSDPTAIRTRARPSGDHWVIDGHKWFTTGAVGAEVAIVMCVTDPEAPPHARASMILVPADTPGFELVRRISLMGSIAAGEGEIRYEDCRVPARNLLGARGAGFRIAQDRLGPGRIHHCHAGARGMRARDRDDVPAGE